MKGKEDTSDGRLRPGEDRVQRAVEEQMRRNGGMIHPSRPRPFERDRDMKRNYPTKG